MERLIGRKKETILLNKLYDSRKSEFVAIYGRRRVGKTFLVKHDNALCIKNLDSS